MSAVVVGVGLDHQDLGAVRRSNARFGQRYHRRWCTAAELARLGEDPSPERLGGLIAAKEAVVKALAPAPDLPVPWTDVEVGLGPAVGIVRLHGQISRHARTLGVRRVQVSHSVRGNLAVALAVALGPPAPTRTSSPLTHPAPSHHSPSDQRPTQQGASA